MNFWLPFTTGNSGSDVSIRFLADALRKIGHDAVTGEFPHKYQYFPWGLSGKRPPKGTGVVIGNSWNAFAFKRKNLPLITVERMFVLDDALDPYRSFAQSVFHHTFLRWCLWRSYKTSDSVIALSRDSAASMLRTFPGCDPQVILNAVDLEFFSPGPPRAALAGRPVRMLFVGNLIRRKGADLLAPILDALGDGFVMDYTSGLRMEERLAAHPQANCIGRLSLEEVREAYQGADLLLLPTRLEGLPRAAMEALACGTPVVASRVSSLPEIILDGYNGLTCPRDDVGAFADAIRGLTADQAAYDHMARNARAFAEEHLDLRRMAQAYVSLAESLCRRESCGA